MKINGWQGGSPHHPYYKPQNLSIMAVDLNRLAIEMAELNRAFTDLVNKADEVFSLIEDADEKEAYYKPFDDGINQAEVALANAAGWVQTEVITNLTFQE